MDILRPMSGNPADYDSLKAGDEFPPSPFTLDATAVSNYRKAVGDDNFSKENMVPPTALAARAMAALAGAFTVPPGTIHVSQEMEFKKAVAVGESLISCSRVERKQERGKFNMLSISILVCNDKNETVMSGKISFILPLD